MKIAIIGYGFVGKALFNALTNKILVKKIDPKLGTNLNDLVEFIPDIIFICLPTPMNSDGSQDISIVESVLNDINEMNLGSLIVLKSTILPDKIVAIQKVIERFVYNPEFLREKHANEDFVNSNLIILGGGIDDTKLLANFYKNYTMCICKDYSFTDAITAAFIKYTINSFLSMKVIFFNELKDLYDVSGANEHWTNFIKYLTLDDRIGSSHMDVPGHDGRKGFGGACLPKDSNAFYKYSLHKKRELSLLKNVISINNKIRIKYNTNTERELIQNITFKGED